MNSKRKEYLDRKNRILKCLDDAEKLMKKSGYDDAASSISAQRKNLENETFTISVVGEFSAGKSTFLNALMGERILTAFSTETTATINYLRHKEKSENGSEVRVFYADGSYKDIEHADADVIEKMVSTRGDNVAEKTDHVDLFIENRFLEDNVTIVDTPGLNGMREGLKEMTMKQIERSSACIFMFYGGQPGRNTDFQTLTDIKNKMNSCFLILNAIDAINGQTVEDVIKIIKDNYKKVYPDEKVIPEIYPISAKQALKARTDKSISQEEKTQLESSSRFEVFENRLWKYLTEGEKGRQILKSPIEMLQSKTDEILDMLAEEENILSGKTDIGEIEGKIAEAENLIAQLEENRKKSSREIKGEIRTAGEDFISSVENSAEKIRDEILRGIDDFTDPDDIDPDNIRGKIHRRFNSALKSAMNVYNSYLRSTIHNLAD